LVRKADAAWPARLLIRKASLWFSERSPSRFAHIAVGKHKALANPAIRRHGVKHASSAFTRSIDDHRAVGCEIRGLVQRARRQRAPARRTQAGIGQRNAVVVAATLCGGQLLAVRRHRHTGVVAALEGY